MEVFYRENHHGGCSTAAIHRDTKQVNPNIQSINKCDQNSQHGEIYGPLLFPATCNLCFVDSTPIQGTSLLGRTGFVSDNYIWFGNPSGRHRGFKRFLNPCMDSFWEFLVEPSGWFEIHLKAAVIMLPARWFPESQSWLQDSVIIYGKFKGMVFTHVEFVLLYDLDLRQSYIILLFYHSYGPNYLL